ncbi:MAG TPA: winged helix-turn-helix domain-containing protein [Bryobacteraceae bacterium]
MSSAATVPSVLRFGAFELDLRRSELRRSGVLLKLSPQQFRLLRFLAENPDRICTRDEIQQTIWGAETFVDFDRSLNVCMAQLRATLNDDSEAPRFIQTVPRRGYRFVAPVERVEDRPSAPQPAPGRRWWVALAAAVVVCLAALFAWRALGPPPRTMLAVLPIENLTGRVEDGVAVEGLVSELIGEFGSALPDRLGVIARTSVMRYAGRQPSVAEVSRDLKADYLVEGEARREASRLRITLRLIRSADQAAVWTDSFEQDDAGGFEMQEDTAARAATGVVRTLFPAAGDRRAPVHRATPQAYDAFLNGRYWQGKDAGRALSWFEQAAVRDPAFAAAWAAIAQTDVRLAFSGIGDARAGLDRARQASQRALAVDETSPEAHDALAQVLLWRDWKWDEAGRHYTRALALNPSFAQAHHDYASWLIAMGRTEAGVSALRRAIALDPLSAHVNVDAGWVLLQAHHFAEAATRAKRALELEPGFQEAQGCLARAEFYSGKRGVGEMDFYRRAMDSADPYRRALANAMLGHKDEALGALEAAYNGRHLLMPMAGTEPAFAALHADSRFGSILQKMGLPY